MSLRKHLLFPLIALLGAAVAVLPALAASTETKIEVNENCVAANWQCWTIPGANPKPALVTIAPGGVVTFADKTGFAASITWKGLAPTCSSGVPVSPAPATTGWEGTCKFEAAGNYQLEDPSMYYPKATVEVSAAGTTPTGTTTTGSTLTGTSGSSTSPSGSGSGSNAPTPGSGPAGASTPAGSLLSGSEAAALELASSQHGQAVHGSVDISSAAAGGRLEVQLLALGSSLGAGAHAARVQVGLLTKSPLRAGTATFSVALDARARRALHRHGHLALRVKITLSATHSSSLTITRAVVMRG
jgi:plastocyanin